MEKKPRGSKMTKNEKNSEYKYSTLTHVLFGFGYFSDNFLTGAVGVRLFAFYENELLLPVVLGLIAYIIYAAWNMVNDPLIGYFSDKPNRFWKKWGRRFPWIVAATLPWPITYILIFVCPPVSEVGALFVFLWLVIIMCLFDFLYSAWNTNFYSLYPDKFRSHKERTRVAGISTAIGQLGIALGFIIPPLFIDYGDQSTYITGSIAIALIAYAGIFLMYPGVKEDEVMRKRLFIIKPEEKKESFFETLKFAIKQKNFFVYLMAYLCFQSFVFIILGSLPYFTPFILQSEAEVESLLSIGFLVGSLASIAGWTYLVAKYGNKKIFIIGFIFTGLALFPLLFTSSVPLSFIIMIFVGVGVGAIWIAVYPIYGEAIDEIVLKTKKREEAIFFGIRIFFARFALIVQAIVFALIHMATGFDPEQAIQTPLALMGIRIQTALIPMLLLFLGAFIFWKWYDLTPLKVEDIKLRLKELQI